MTKPVATGKIFVTAFLDFRTHKKIFQNSGMGNESLDCGDARNRQEFVHNGWQTAI